MNHATDQDRSVEGGNVSQEIKGDRKVRAWDGKWEWNESCPQIFVEDYPSEPLPETQYRVIENTPENIEAIGDAVDQEIPNPAWDDVYDVTTTVLRVLGLTGGG